MSLSDFHQCSKNYFDQIKRLKKIKQLFSNISEIRRMGSIDDEPPPHFTERLERRFHRGAEATQKICDAFFVTFL